MKAQHRKELQTNVLAAQITRVVEGVKSRPNNRTLVIAGVVVGIIALVVGWVYMSGRSRAKESGYWMSLYDAVSTQAVADVANEARGSEAGLTAEFREARVALREGLEGLAAPREQKAAAEKIRRAGELYEKLTQRRDVPPVLAQEALLNAGKAKESLGDLEGALSWYEKAASTYPKSEAGKQAADRAEKIKSQRAQVKDFYNKLDSDPARNKP